MDDGHRSACGLRPPGRTSHFDRGRDMGRGSKYFATQFVTRPIYLMRGAGIPTPQMLQTAGHTSIATH